MDGPVLGSDFVGCSMLVTPAVGGDSAHERRYPASCGHTSPGCPGKAWESCDAPTPNAVLGVAGPASRGLGLPLGVRDGPAHPRLEGAVSSSCCKRLAGTGSSLWPMAPVRQRRRPVDTGCGVAAIVAPILAPAVW